MAEHQLPRRVRLRGGVLATTTADGMTLVNAAGEVFHLNLSGRIAVVALERTGTTAAALTALQERYTLDPVTAERDLHRLLAQLRRARLVRTR